MEKTGKNDEKENGMNTVPETGGATEEERLWLEMERERQVRQKPYPERSRRNDLPRKVGNEDVRTLRNLAPDNLFNGEGPKPNVNANNSAGNASTNPKNQSPTPERSSRPSPPKVVPFATRPGTPLDTYVEPEACPMCRGAGFLRMDVPVGDPSFGRIIDCECRVAEKERRNREELNKASNLEHFRKLTFDSFNQRIPGVGVKEAYQVTRHFATDPSAWLLLMGGYGCGKTHLAAAIANEALQKGIRLYFAVVPDLLDYLRATFDPNSDASYDERFDMIRNVPLLILDDLGTENSKPWAREKLYQIINHRYNAKLPTVITTNQDLYQIDGRIHSRITDRQLCTQLLIQADDYRQIPPAERTRLRQGPISGPKRNFP
jgi:DNA replication protein DnaC